MKEIETEVLRLIGENPDSPDVFTDDPTDLSGGGISWIRESLNDAVEEICLLTGSVKRKYQLIARTGESFYRLVFARDQYAWVVDAWNPTYRRRLEQTDIFRLNKWNPRWMQNLGTPQSYFPLGNNIIGLWPAPGGDNFTIELNCVIIPERYKSADERIKIRQAWQDIAVHFGACEYYASIGDVANATHEWQHFTSLMAILVGFPIAADRRPVLRTEKERYPKPTGG